ncbi:SagB/ThcOx family dehydrogenase [Candidatus Neptunochlamydia vexilliferae]|uniref:Nitroreductase domain-containing protein n=1 Tax=Candidatus Neptunichlamydia vexilliferae TaxID=1651774 RepID=A0ABS0AZG9_9BACT|nr:SagB/ThcOx family dehydrogenase [Candidatus Neptunochlamydia vexilliferae]MBF5059002.1 hypothetical protein [Candidatus Neptunochlamydia vexilliferae]
MATHKDHWDDLLWGVPPNQEKLEEGWEAFHENSKLCRSDRYLSQTYVLQMMNQLALSIEYGRGTRIPLPEELYSLDISLGEVIKKRRTARYLSSIPLSFKEIATLLHYAYGVTKSSTTTPFRAVPSGGALYPLEVYFQVLNSEDLELGLYHYNPIRNSIFLLESEEDFGSIADHIVFKEIADGASLIFFIAASFKKSTFKYNERGYRFILMEAGHLMQNINLTATALGLELALLGGFFDREIDDRLHFDGINQSTIYIGAVGGKGRPPS